MSTQPAHYYSLNTFLQERHGEKVMKLSIDGGFTCPNRDGKVASGGCIFCSARGSGDFTDWKLPSITEQLSAQVQRLSKKWPNVKKYIAYFQSYSNTYADVATLREKYEEALAFPGVVGLAIATRPDCLNDEIIAYLRELNTRTHLWIELGLQTIHTHSSEWMNRGHSLDCFDQAVFELNRHHIEVVAHMIVGLPEETDAQILMTAQHLAILPLQGIKIHMLHVLNDTALGKQYIASPFPLLQEDHYIFLLGEILKILPKTMVIHRLTGDGDRRHLLAPLWTLQKIKVRNAITKYLETHQIYQGTS